MATNLTDAEFETLTRLVYDLTGITIEPSKRALLSSRIRRRLRVLEISTVSDYLGLLQGRKRLEEECVEFVDVVTTHKTSFFRTPSVWDFLESDLPSSYPADRPLRIWSCACSNGQEAYSLALLLNSLRGQPKSGSWSVLATDVSERTVDRARSGRYEKEDLDELRRLRPQVRPEDHFLPAEDGVRVGPTLSDPVRFRVHNLMEPLSERFDVAFLRNVLIYFSDEDKRRIVDQVLGTLPVGGLLVIGESESLLGHDGDIDYLGPCLYRKTA